ncbi:MAG TPA: VOC family protein [Tepidisphaeraceae bacterium]|jgi:catechol 2,3-dioxygenase-like lactoylglutathione lyase family enzyme|nr:VOC family protein [Tepidisphaeraceae bacterium]
MPNFGRVAPSIPVSDMNLALRFYCDVLGFTVAFTNGDPVSFAVVDQGDAQLHLSVQPAKAGSSHAHLMVDDVDGVYERLRQAAVVVRQPPKVQPWGLRDLVVADPDGNTFEVAEPVGKPASA